MWSVQLFKKICTQYFVGQWSVFSWTSTELEIIIVKARWCGTTGQSHFLFTDVQEDWKCQLIRQREMVRALRSPGEAIDFELHTKELRAIWQPAARHLKCNLQSSSTAAPMPVPLLWKGLGRNCHFLFSRKNCPLGHSWIPKHQSPVSPPFSTRLTSESTLFYVLPLATSQFSSLLGSFCP